MVCIDLHNAEMSSCCVWSFGPSEEEPRFTCFGGDCWREAALSETGTETCLGSARPTTQPGSLCQVCVCVRKIKINLVPERTSSLFLLMVLVCVLYREILLKMVCGTQTLVCYKSKDLLRTALRHFNNDLSWKQGKTPTSTHIPWCWSTLTMV